jgi:hypothetical protein
VLSGVHGWPQSCFAFSLNIILPVPSPAIERKQLMNLSLS